MTLREMAILMWLTVGEVLNLEFPVMEYRINLMQVFIFGCLIVLLLRFLFHFGSKGDV